MLSPLLSSFTASGPHRDRRTFFFSSAAIPSPLTRFWDRNNPRMEEQSISYGILQMIYRWKALGEKNMLEQFIFSIVYCASLAWEMKFARLKYGESNSAIGSFN
jgi:hypothetical protein